MSLTPLEREITRDIARRRDDLVALAADLVAFDTRAPEGPNGSREEAALQAYVAERMAAAGLAVRVWEPDPADIAPTRYPIPDGHDFRGRPQLLATATGAGGGRALLLNGHIDVVTAEPEDAWTTPPFTPVVRDGRLYGRGACDMKGGLACLLGVTELLRARQVPLAGDLLVSTVTDEESTGAGALAVAATGVRADGCLVAEATGLEVCLGTRGSLLPAIDVEGRAGHAGFPPTHWSEGGPVNAIEKMQLVLEALQRLRHEWQLRADCRHEALSPGSIVPTSMHAGQWIVSVPAECRLECHVQFVPGQADADGLGSRVEREIEARVLTACAADPWLAEHPPRFTWAGDVPASWVKPDAPVAATTLDAMEAMGLPRTLARVTGFFDGATFVRHGIPSIAFGPGETLQAHTVDESLPIDQLVRCAQVFAVIVMRFCGLAA